MERIRSGCLGCGSLLMTLGIIGLISTFANLGESRRAILVIFYDLANRFGSVSVFSIITILAGLLLIILVFLEKELRSGNDRR